MLICKGEYHLHMHRNMTRMLYWEVIYEQPRYKLQSQPFFIPFAVLNLQSSL